MTRGRPRSAAEREADLLALAIDPSSHRIAEISYRAETIECTCGAMVTAPPDNLFRDRHQPLVDAWAEHGLAARRGRAEARAQRLAATRAAAVPPPTERAALPPVVVAPVRA